MNLHRNRHIKAGFAGGKFMRVIANKQLSPHGEGIGAPKSRAKVRSCQINHALLSKLQQRNAALKKRMKDKKDSRFAIWKAIYEDRKKSILSMV